MPSPRPIARRSAPSQSGVQSLRRLTICGRSGRPVSVDTHTIPVIGRATAPCWARSCCCTTPRRKPRWSSAARASTKRPPSDPLTQVANRAEFDRVHEMFVAAHQQQQVPCSMIICDLDRFKLVNDTYGHQAGDDAIKSLADAVEERLPARRPGGPLRRRRVRHALRRLRQRRRRPPRRADPQGVEPDAAAEDGRPLHHRQLRRHRNSARRHPGNHAPPRRPGAVDGQGQGAQLVVQLGSGGGEGPPSRNAASGSAASSADRK